MGHFTKKFGLKKTGFTSKRANPCKGPNSIGSLLDRQRRWVLSKTVNTEVTFLKYVEFHI